MVPIFFKTKDEVMWFAISMFEGKFLAFPKYYIENGKKIKGISYSQWYIDIPEKLRKYHTYVRGIGEKAFLVNPKDIEEYYNPILRTKNISDGIAEETKHIKILTKLILKIQNIFQIPIEDIGIDGSSLLGDYKETSDLDILVYGNENGEILKNKFNFINDEEIKLFTEEDIDINKDIPKTVYTTGFGEEKAQAFKQFLRRYYGYIGDKRFSIVCVPKEKGKGYINLNRDIQRKGIFSGQVIILDDKYSGIVPTIYKIVDENGNVYSLEIFNHYGINQAKVGERFSLTGQIYENKENKEKTIIISFWTDTEQSFSLVEREKKQEIVDRLRTLIIQLEEEKDNNTKNLISRILNEISSKYTEISKEEAIKQTISCFKNNSKRETDSFSFKINPIDILNMISKDREKLKEIKQTRCGLNFYCVEAPNCGELYENNGIEKTLNYATFITFAENNELIALLPTEKVEFRKRIKEKDDEGR